MKRIIEDFKTLISIIIFSFKLCYNASKFYLIVNLLINCCLIVIPFASLYIGSKTLGYVADSLIINADIKKKISGFAVLIVLTFIINIISNSMQSLTFYIKKMYTEQIDSKLKCDIMKKASYLEMKYFDSPDFFDTLNDVNYNSSMISNLVFVVFDFIKSFAQFVIAFVNVAVWKWFAPLIVLITSVPTMLIKNKQLKCEYDFQRNNMKYDRQMFYVTNISVDRNNAQDVKMFGLFSELKHKFYSIWNEMFKKKRKLVRKYTVLAMLFDCLPQIVIVAFMLILGISVLNGNMNIQKYSYVNGLISQLGSLVLSVIVAYGLIFDSKIRLKNYIQFMEMNAENEGKSDVDFKDTKFELEFRNVFFKYNDESDYVLKGVNFKIRSDETYALVGVNGCGKTSIIKLILRFYEPTEGQILLNGKDVKEYSIESVRRLFSPMFQNYNNYAFTVREDIYLSDLENKDNDEKIISASVQSGADEFVREFDNGYDSYLTRQYEEGTELSGGQWQKIAISRTFFRKSLMYILDEPSSAIDAESEDELFANFDKLFEHSGGILVSHRLSNVKKCDNIIVIDNGVVAEEGTHEQLIINRKKYAHMFELQANKYQ